jgi:[acyl-carrier-protein] S-malonyltransferase
VAAGTLTFADALHLVRRRGELMQDAVPFGQGGMAVLIGLSDPVVEEVVALARQDQVCAVANLNSPGQTVIAGHLEAVERVVDLAKERNAKRAKLLPVSAPFHSPLMLPARQGLAPLLQATNMAAPAAPVISNVDAMPVLTGAAAKDALERQVDGTVRWVESVEHMAGNMGAEIFVEIGPGNVLTGIGRRMITEATWLSLPKPEALEKLATKLKEATQEDLSVE